MEKSSAAHSQHSAPSFEASSQDLHLQSKMRTIRTVDTARVGVTAAALLMGLSVLGVSANTLRVHHNTNISSDYFLPLWPDEFSIRPTMALVAGSVFVVVSSILSLAFSKVSSVCSQSIFPLTLPHILTPLTLATIQTNRSHLPHLRLTRCGTHRSPRGRYPLLFYQCLRYRRYLHLMDVQMASCLHEPATALGYLVPAELRGVVSRHLADPCRGHRVGAGCVPGQVGEVH